MAGSAFPEHAEEECREEGRVDEGEDQLEQVHDVVETDGGVGGEDGGGDAGDGGEAADL